MTVKGIFKYLLSIVVDFFYPPRCSLCGKYIEHREDILCADCSEKILTVDHLPEVKPKIDIAKDYDNARQAIHNLKPVFYANNPAKILAVGRSPYVKPPIKEVWRITKYRGGTRKIILDIKSSRKHLYKSLIVDKILERAVKSEPQLLALLNNIDVAVAVPLHAEREKKRGYNQVELIFSDWLNRHNIHMDRLLLRTKVTEHLFALNPIERRKQMADAFSLADGAETKVKGKRILILDDIFTTGATMNECAKVLQLSGAAEIYGLALASDFGAHSNN